MLRKSLFLTAILIGFAGSSITDRAFREKFNSLDELLATPSVERCELITKVLEKQKAGELLIQAVILTSKAFQLLQKTGVQQHSAQDSTLDEAGIAEGACPTLDYPYFNEQCTNVSGNNTSCRDIRECHFADAIFALGGWPTVCGWVEDEVDDSGQVMRLPKVCCGTHLPVVEPRKKQFVLKTAKKSGFTTPATKENEIRDNRIDYAMVTDIPTEAPELNPVQCVLPLVPQPDVTPDDGVRFGNTPYSRQEFVKNSEFLLNIMHDSNFSMEFKTSGNSGVMFYLSTGSTRRDFIGLVMQDGKIVYVFDCGLGTAMITSENAYNDGKWHRVVFQREGQDGELVIDGLEEIRGRSPGKATRVNHLVFPFFVGGLSEEIAGRAKTTMNLQGITTSFPGCIRNLEAQHVPQDVQTTSAVNGSPCSSKVEKGTFFSGGHLVLKEKHRVGQLISISFDMKPRNLSGVLLSIHGKEDFLHLELVEGRLELTIDSGSGPTTLTYTGIDLCDGRFHTVKVEYNTLMILTVDGVSSEKGADSPIDTYDPLYLGGLPDWSERGVQSKNSFVGCIRNLQLNDVLQSMAMSRLAGSVILNTCPTT